MLHKLENKMTAMAFQNYVSVIGNAVPEISSACADAKLRGIQATCIVS